MAKLIFNLTTVNKIAAIGLLSVLGLAFIISAFSGVMSYELTSALYQVDGLGFIGFGIWAAYLLL